MSDDLKYSAKTAQLALLDALMCWKSAPGKTFQLVSCSDGVTGRDRARAGCRWPEAAYSTPIVSSSSCSVSHSPSACCSAPSTRAASNRAAWIFSRSSPV